MANNNKHTGPNVPALRFPEFSGEWEKFRVSDFIEFFPTNSLSWDQLEYRGAGLLNLHYGMIHNGLPVQVDVSKNALPSIKEDYYPKKYTLCKEGDIAFADASEDTNDVGKAIEFNNCAGKSIVCGLHTIHGRDRLGLTSIGFKGYLFSSKVYHDQIKSIAQGTKVFSIKASNFDEVILGLPKKEEQKKILSLLMTIDDRILTQSKIIEELTTLRSALLEKVFQVSNPTLEVGAIAHQTSERNKLCRYSNVLSVSNRFGFINQSEQFEDRNVASDDVRNYKVVHRGDFSYNPARINVGSIAMLKNFESGIVSPMYICFQVDDTIVDPSFFELFLETKAFKDEMEIRLEGSVRRCLSFEALCEIHLPRPALLVQRSISDKIGNISSKIKLEDRILRAYIRQKEWLLKQMFI